MNTYLFTQNSIYTITEENGVKTLTGGTVLQAPLVFDSMSKPVMGLPVVFYKNGRQIFRTSIIKDAAVSVFALMATH